MKKVILVPGTIVLKKRETSRGMRRAAKKSCRPEQEERITLTSKSRNLHGYSSLLFS